MSIKIFTDGSSRGNPGKGGYGVVLLSGKYRKEISCGFNITTNNRMELLAVIVGLEAVKKENSIITVYSDSKYVVDAIEKSGFLIGRKRKFKNKKILIFGFVFLKIYRKQKVSFVWVKGHSNIEENERCDFLAVEASKVTL